MAGRTVWAACRECVIRRRLTEQVVSIGAAVRGAPCGGMSEGADIHDECSSLFCLVRLICNPFPSIWAMRRLLLS